MYINNPRGRLLLGIRQSPPKTLQARMSPILPHLYLSTSKKQPHSYHLQHQLQQILSILSSKTELGRGTGLAVDNTTNSEATRPILCNSGVYGQTLALMAQLFPNLQFYENSLIVLEGRATKRLFVYISNMKKLPFSSCCVERLDICIDSRKVTIKCSACLQHFISILVPTPISQSSHLSELDKWRASKLVDSGRYMRINILESIKGSHNTMETIKTKERRRLQPLLNRSLPVELDDL